MRANFMRGGGLRGMTLGLAVALLLAACETAPVTGRQQLVLVPEKQLTEIGREAYQDIIATHGTSADPAMNELVTRVGQRVARVSAQPDLDWQFAVIDDETANAFALPGGYVGVHRGLFNVVENEDQLAAVMAHEVGHVVARHHAERMSRQGLVQTGIAVALGGASDAAVQLASAAASLGLILPFSRDQESEADAIGLQYMAQAGYDPRAAVQVWENFQRYGGPGGPAFLSTHPAAEDRIRDLEAMMPRALETYEQARRN